MNLSAFPMIKLPERRFATCANGRSVAVWFFIALAAVLFGRAVFERPSSQSFFQKDSSHFASNDLGNNRERLTTTWNDVAPGVLINLRESSRNATNTRLARTARTCDGGDYFNGRVAVDARFRFPGERGGLAPSRFWRLRASETSPRPLWLFLLVFLN